MKRSNKIGLAFRDGCNKLMGKDPLIKEYHDIVLAISQHSDSLAGKKEQKPVLEALNSLTEAYTEASKYGGVSMGNNFNPYAVTTLPGKLKKKIAEGRAIIAQYDIKLRKGSR